MLGGGGRGREFFIRGLLFFASDIEGLTDGVGIEFEVIGAPEKREGGAGRGEEPGEV